MGSRKGGGLRVVLGLVLAFVLAAVAYAGVLMMGARDIETEVVEAQSEAKSITLALRSLDFTEAANASERMQGHLDKASRRMASWEWQIAARLPVLGGDVVIMREGLAIASRAGNEAIGPLTSSIHDTLATGNILTMLQSLTAEGGLVSQVVQAHDVVDECVQSADELGAPRSEKVREGIEGLRSTLTDLDAVLDALVDTPRDTLDSLDVLMNGEDGSAVDAQA